MQLKLDPYTVRLEVDERGQISLVRVQKRFADFANYLPKIEADPNGPPTFDLRGGPHLHDLVEFLQHIESLGSFWCGIERIHWQDAEFEWLPDSPEEGALLTVKAFSSTYSFPDITIAVTQQHLYHTVARRDQQRRLVIPLAFYREGVNEFAAHRFLYSFFNFYFFLEDLFGSGKTKNYQIAQEFEASQPLRKAVGEVIDDFNEPRMADHRAVLVEYLELERCELSIEGVIQLLVSMRGNLHHFSQKSSKLKGHPLNQRRFETLALLTMSVCARALPGLLFPERANEPSKVDPPTA